MENFKLKALKKKIPQLNVRVSRYAVGMRICL